MGKKNVQTLGYNGARTVFQKFWSKNQFSRTFNISNLFYTAVIKGEGEKRKYIDTVKKDLARGHGLFLDLFFQLKYQVLSNVACPGAHGLWKKGLMQIKEACSVYVFCI